MFLQGQTLEFNNKDMHRGVDLTAAFISVYLAVRASVSRAVAAAAWAMASVLWEAPEIRAAKP